MKIIELELRNRVVHLFVRNGEIEKKDTYYLTQYDIYSCHDSMDIEDDYNTSETHCVCGVRKR